MKQQPDLFVDGAIAVALTSGLTAENAVAMVCKLHGTDPADPPSAYKIAAQRINDIQKTK
tara:strand:- start:305 stop:484 length:180 start_codon:yes stop_codon:yes gene_type:complete